MSVLKKKIVASHLYFFTIIDKYFLLQMLFTKITSTYQKILPEINYLFFYIIIFL